MVKLQESQVDWVCGEKSDNAFEDELGENGNKFIKKNG